MIALLEEINAEIDEAEAAAPGAER